MSNTIDNTGTTLNFKLKEDQIWKQTFTFTDSLDAAIDLTVYNEIHMQLRRRPSATVILEAKLTDGDFVISGAGNNVLDLTLFVDAVAGTYVYDIDFIGTNTNDQFIKGQIHILPQITIQAV